MMRQICAFALLFFVASQAGAQQPVPPRFDPLAKNERFRLLRVHGLPEVLVTFWGPLSGLTSDGKFALFTEDLSTRTDEKTQLRTRLLLYDLIAKTWPREFEIEGKDVTALDMSADCGRVLVAQQVFVGKANAKRDTEKYTTKDFRAYLSLWDLKEGKEVYTIPTEESYISCVALGPDGITALAGSGEAVKRWNLQNGKKIGVFKAPKREVTALKYLPKGERFLAGYTQDCGETLWNINNQKGEPLHKEPLGGNRWVHQLAVSSDGKRYVVGEIKLDPFFLPPLRLVDVPTRKKIGEHKGLLTTLTGLAIAEDGKSVFSVWNESHEPRESPAVRLMAWDGEANKVLWSHPVSYRGRPPMLVKGDKLLVGGGPNLFEVWSIKDGKKLQSWGGHRSPVHAIAVLPNGDILSGGNEGQVMTWRKGEIVNKLDAHVGSISALVIDAERKQWLSAGADKTIKVWAIDKDKPTHVLKGHSGPITSLAIAPKGNWAASASGDRSVRTWDLATGKEIATLPGHTDGVNAVAITHDGAWIASASDDATIRLWPVKAGKLDPDREVITLDDHKKAVTSLAFSPDGTLLSGSKDQTLILWDWPKGKVTRTISGHKNWVTSLLFTDDRKVLTTSDDLSMCWWNIDTGKELGRVDFGVVGDCPRCLARLGNARVLVGSSSWLIYEMQMLPAKTK
jgi:WD40 repeat protein